MKTGCVMLAGNCTVQLGAAQLMMGWMVACACAVAHGCQRSSGA